MEGEAPTMDRNDLVDIVGDRCGVCGMQGDWEKWYMGKSAYVYKRHRIR